VNFLLHRHLAATALGSALAGAGAMLPDLWRMADRRVRARQVALATGDLPGGALGQILAGVEHHLESDRWFHGAAVFVDGEHELAARLAEARLSASRMGLLAHILWELCLDGALVRRVGLAPTLEALAAALPAAAPHDAAAIAACHAVREPFTDEEQAGFAQRMDRLRAALLEGRWIAAYQDGRGLAEVTSGIRRRLELPPLGDEDAARLATILDGLAARADEAAAEIVRTR
jgi:hypothetical protein